MTITYGVIPLFDALVREESHHRAMKFGHKNRLYAIIRWKPGIYISSGLESVPGCDTRTDSQRRVRTTDGRTDGRTDGQTELRSQYTLCHVRV